MGKIFAIMCLSFAYPAMAAMSVYVQPEEPKVVNADLNPDPQGQLIRGPWFKASYDLGASTLTTVKRMIFKIKSAEGNTKTQTYDFTSSPQIRPDGLLNMEIYLGDLPRSQSHRYTVELTVNGWTGADEKDGRPFAYSNTFRTN